MRLKQLHRHHHRHHHHHHGSRLQRRLFWWFGGAIALTVASAGLVFAVLGPSSQWEKQVDRMRRFGQSQIAAAWDDPQRRRELVGTLARDLEVDATFVDTSGRVLEGGAPCERRRFELPVEREGRPLGIAFICFDRVHTPPAAWKLALSLLVVFLMLWALAGRVARRLSRPLAELASVARDLGQGRLSSRARLACGAPGEFGQLAESVNEMASRIERQLTDQRELLAGVSHELRTPLARVRLLIELMRDGAGPERLDEIEREAVEMDALVGELLASSKLDFSALDRRPIDPVDAARRAVERAGLPETLVEASQGISTVDADPTLLARALSNLIENAKRHGSGLSKLRVATGTDGMIELSAEDSGPGLPEGASDKIFQPFATVSPDGRKEGSLGLGLALVRRIAIAHGGRVFAGNQAEGGARVGLALPGA